MTNKNILCLIGFLCVTLIFPPAASAVVVINEFLADPPSGIAGDANRDGVRSASDDEFVELLGAGDAAQDLSLWSLWDRVALRHRFPQETSLAASGRIVVFGGGSPTGVPGWVATASSGVLSLNNSGDEIILKDAFGGVVDHVIYSSEADHDQSLTRFPEGTGPFLLHRLVSSRELLFSPGTDPDGGNPQATHAIPEPATGTLLGIGFAAMGIVNRRSKPR